MFGDQLEGARMRAVVGDEDEGADSFVSRHTYPIDDSVRRADVSTFCKPEAASRVPSLGTLKRFS